MRSLAATLLVLLIAAPALPAAGAEMKRPVPIRYRYVVHPLRSRVSLVFRMAVVPIPIQAHFAVLRGEVFLSAGDPFRGAEGHLIIEAASLRTKDPLQQRMLLDHVLEAERHPRIELLADRARPQGKPEKRRLEKDWDLRARGRLRLHGKEHEVPLAFRLADTGTDLYIRGAGRMSLSAFGLSRPTALLVVPGQDTVEVNVRLVAEPAPRR